METEMDEGSVEPEPLESDENSDEVTDRDLEEIDAGDGGQETYPPYL